jgi:DNA modification methylase
MLIQTLQGDCREILKSLPDNSVNCCVTSPPYFGLRDYQVAGQIGLEETPAEYVAALVEVFREVKRVLRPDGSVWLNLGDSYAAGGNGPGSSHYQDNLGKGTTLARALPAKKAPVGLKPKDLIGIPWRVAFALQEDGWWLRSDIIWAKSNPMPESVTDRPTKSHEYIFLLTRSAKYFYDAAAIAEPTVRPGDVQTFGGKKGLTLASRSTDEPKDPNFRNGHEQWGRTIEMGDTRNKRTVWTVPNQPFSGSHFATFPEKLIEPCILAGCPAGGTVLDPFGGSGTTGRVAVKHGRNAILIELNPEYHKLIDERTDKVQIKMAI